MVDKQHGRLAGSANFDQCFSLKLQHKPLCASTPSATQGKCYNGICQPGAKISEVKSISPLGIPANNTEWIWLRYTTTSPNAALAQFVNLAGEAGRTTVPLGMTASVTNAVRDEAPEDPRSPGSPLTSALLMIDPQGFAPPMVPVAEPLDKVEAALYYRSNTPDHPPGIFNGMKVGGRALRALHWL